MIPNPGNLIGKLELAFPLIGFYDSPDTLGFEPLIEPEPGKNVCIYKSYNDWKEGKTLHLTRENSGCGGCSHWIFGKETRSREDMTHFLAVTEGLKDTIELIDRWLSHEKPYKPEHPHILIGPLKETHYEHLKTVTFLVNADQLGALTIGAQYFHSPEDIYAPVISPMGAGCMQLVSLFRDLYLPQAIIGATDIAMRLNIPPNTLAFTVTEPMYRQLCQLDERSFLFKPFWNNLKKSRKSNLREDL
jgi:hypothetical protein